MWLLTQTMAKESPLKLPPVSFRDVNRRHQAILTGVLERVNILQEHYREELKSCQADQSIDQKTGEICHTMIAEFGFAVGKLGSMYNLERFIVEQEHLQQRLPALEDEIRRMRPRENQLLEQAKEREKTIRDLQLRLKAVAEDHRPCNSALESLRTRVVLLQEEVDRLNNIRLAQMTVEAKAREAFALVQDENAALEDLVQDNKAQYQNALHITRQRFETMAEEIRDSAHDTKARVTHFMSDCHRKLERVERGAKEQLRERNGRIAELEHRLALLSHEQEPLRQALADQTARLAEVSEQFLRQSAAQCNVLAEDAHLRRRVRDLEAEVLAQGRVLCAVQRDLADSRQLVLERDIDISLLREQVHASSEVESKLATELHAASSAHEEAMAEKQREAAALARDKDALRKQVLAAQERQALQVQRDVVEREEREAAHRHAKEALGAEVSLLKGEMRIVAQDLLAERARWQAQGEEKAMLERRVSACAAMLEEARAQLYASRSAQSRLLGEVGERSHACAVAGAACKDLQLQLHVVAAELHVASNACAADGVAMQEERVQCVNQCGMMCARIEGLECAVQAKDAELVEMARQLAAG
jgi:hypothetical protein